MPAIDLWLLSGLVGVTLVISVGKVFDPLRLWLLGFEKRINPLRIFGDLLSCSMCVGWWVGFLWVLLHRGGLDAAILSGGLVSITAYVTDETLAFVDVAMRRFVGPVTMPPKPVARPRIKSPGPLTEEEDEAEQP